MIPVIDHLLGYTMSQHLNALNNFESAHVLKLYTVSRVLNILKKNRNPYHGCFVHIFDYNIIFACVVKWSQGNNLRDQQILLVVYIVLYLKKNTFWLVYLYVRFVCFIEDPFGNRGATSSNGDSNGQPGPNYSNPRPSHSKPEGPNPRSFGQSGRLWLWT